MGWARVALALVAVGAAGALLVSGGSEADPQTPAGLAGMPPPFLGVAVLGDGGLTAAVDAYGDVVDLRTPGPAGRALIENPSDRQAAGTVPADTGIQFWVQAEGNAPEPMWHADRIEQSYLPDASVLRTVAWFGRARVEVRQAVHGGELAIVVDSDDSTVRLRENAAGEVVTRAPRVLAEAAASDRRWLARARPLGEAAPKWARQMYGRSLLVLHALTDRRTGAVAAGARDGWAFVWPRDAAAVAIAFAAAGYRSEAELVTRFLLGLGLEEAARFHGDGSPVSGRAAQGDAIGWVAAASHATGIIGSARHAARILAGGQSIPWRDRADYWEGEPGDHIANAIGAGRATKEEIAAGQDSAVAWAARPFSRPRLYPAVRETLGRLTADRTRFGITPGEDWSGEDPWSAPTAWTAWSLAALGERRRALQLMSALRRSATPAGDLPERVDVHTGIPRSTTPLAWSHAFAILALRELWPSR